MTGRPRDCGLALDQGATLVICHSEKEVATRTWTTFGYHPRARRIVKANVAIAGTFIAVLVCWDVLGHLPLPLGVAGHEGSTVIVGLNGLRLLTPGAWRRARQEGNAAR